MSLLLIRQYYTYPDYSVDRYLHVYLEDGVTIAPMVMKAERLKYSVYDKVNRRFNYSAFALAGERSGTAHPPPVTPLHTAVVSRENE